MTKKTDIESIPRERWEVEKAAEEIRRYLIRLCEDYDRGNTFAIVLVAVILRTLLKTKGRSISVFEQLGWHTNLFVDSRVPEGGFSFWEIGDNVSNHTFLLHFGNRHHWRSLKIIVDGQVARFNQNPVYVTVRQIAWEVLESWGEGETT